MRHFVLPQSRKTREERGVRRLQRQLDQEDEMFEMNETTREPNGRARSERLCDVRRFLHQVACFQCLIFCYVVILFPILFWRENMC